MIESSLISADMLVDDLRQLCAIPTSADQSEAATAANHIAALMRLRGLQSEIIATAGAPLVVGRRAGKSPFTLLLYHHYDAAPAGPWRAWNHEPFLLAEREGCLYGRGVADGKGPLAAHLAAIASLLATEGELPIGVVVVADGESIQGSPHLGALVAEHRQKFRADACLATAGERDMSGNPICYGGAKGLLQVRLTAIGANQILPAGMAATVPNPIWQLTWALAQIKSSDEEILIDGFYDDVESPNRVENQLLRAVRVDEAKRLEAWGIEHFLFDMTGATLTTAEATLPTCNISAFSVEPQAENTGVPIVATARVDFQLVPRQRPQVILERLREHLRSKGFDSINVERMTGGYPAASTPPEHPFVQRVRSIGQQSYGEPFVRLPLGPFALPLYFFAEAFTMPLAVVGCARQDSATYGPNERIPLRDLIHHGQVLVDLLTSYTQNP